MNLPQAFIDKYQHLLGDEADAFLTALNQEEVQKGFRLNPLKPHAKEMLTKFDDRNLPKAPFANDGYVGEISGKSILHQAGYVYSQEISAMIVASVADVQPGERVLDLCAAPGGKSTQLAASLANQGLLVANEIYPKRAKILAENLERWGAQNTVVTNHAPAELVDFFPQFFDTIVVDAPCSGEGMFRKDEEAIQQWQADTPEMCATRQKEILDAAVRMLKKDGMLVYSTCTFAPEENEEMVSFLVENYPFEIVPLSIAETSPGRSEWGSVPHLEDTVRIWPHINDGEGHFVAKLRLKEAIISGDVPKQKAKKAKKGKNVSNDGLNKEQQKVMQDFTKHWPLPFAGKLVTFKNNLWLLPQEMISLEKLKVLKPGLQLGVFKKNRFEPTFAWTMAIEDVSAYPSCPITLEDWQRYVRGETILKEGNQGWVVLVVDQIPVGLGKQVQGVIKNFYPKGLRFQP